MESEEKEELRNELMAGTSHLLDFENEVFFKVPFEYVCDLVQKRAVFISKGVAFVPKSESISMVLSDFKANLERELQV